MLQRRSWLIRLSVVLNIIVVLYVGAHMYYQNRRSSDGVFDVTGGAVVVPEGGRAGEASRRILLDIGSLPPSFVAPSTNTLGPGSSTTPTNRTQVTTEHVSTTLSSKVQSNIECDDIPRRQFTAQRGDFWVLHNYIKAERQFKCWESITYTTHADYTFLDNLEPLLDRWKGPISLAMHAPGYDFNKSIETIRYLRDCSPQPISEFVTFHFFFPNKHLPKVVPKPWQALEGDKYNCSLQPPWVDKATYKAEKKLTYPINVGRNIAREMATTHYILASDIELYPSPGVIPDFLDMVKRHDPPLKHKKPKVFPLSIFELEANMSLPSDKTELVAMLKNGTAIPFHKRLCPGCHNVPHTKEWLKANSTMGGLRVFHIGKRTGYFIHWEPIYIGTNSDPFYDERLSWEGKSDKMTQGYILCVLDYEFQILDNAFLVHRPGIKKLKRDPVRAMQASKTNSLIKYKIFPELKILYGTRKGCAV
ncbi:beta-1,4-glucuronyltransferase 1 [Cimex lectularius]|uniref:N-acetyllactosaminide beta-1,3-N-acetylglucosaminyltransferase n=1 Tax=Cimex lectularius TaxID=79782 RepID=A0A8I6TF18_CIMLE|nr:beta-1,4-glucuronyltransferase 1 [Cimex lectularius]XP_014251106.1 beta-1,4-glucuronyltransferase 1 [Cimex lectularius]XP_024083757.1 beta-1,4-glucuronyltransferase 1 [Cimex lectularius]